MSKLPPWQFGYLQVPRNESFIVFRKQIAKQSKQEGIGHSNHPSVNYTPHTTAEKLAWLLNCRGQPQYVFIFHGTVKFNSILINPRRAVLKIYVCSRQIKIKNKSADKHVESRIVAERKVWQISEVAINELGCFCSLTGEHSVDNMDRYSRPKAQHLSVQSLPTRTVPQPRERHQSCSCSQVSIRK